MDWDDYEKWGKEGIKWGANYRKTISNINLQNKKIIYANKFFCWQALKIDLILKIYFMFNDYIETLVLELI
mgnify:CR=1 FL=1